MYTLIFSAKAGRWDFSVYYFVSVEGQELCAYVGKSIQHTKKSKPDLYHSLVITNMLLQV